MAKADNKQKQRYVLGDDVLDNVIKLTDEPEALSGFMRTATEDDKKQPKAKAAKSKPAPEKKAAKNPKKTDWRKRNGVKTISDAPADEVPFAWANPLIITSKAYTSRLMSRLHKERLEYAASRTLTKYDK